MQTTKNGTHTRNGHAANGVHRGNESSRGNRLAGLPPLATVVTVNGNGTQHGNHDAGGRFAKGNKAASGNPNARRMAAHRAAMLDAVSEDDIKAITRELVARAKGGDVAAAKLVLVYLVGKPADVVDPDRLDLDEWSILDAAPTLAQVMRAQLDGVIPEDAIEKALAAMKLRPRIDCNDKMRVANACQVEMKARIGKRR